MAFLDFHFVIGDLLYVVKKQFSGECHFDSRPLSNHYFDGRLFFEEQRGRPKGKQGLWQNLSEDG